MMDAARLRAMGLSVVEGPSGQTVELALEHVRLENPLTRRPLRTVLFSGVGDRLLVVEPPELTGLPPFAASRPAELELEVAQAFQELVAQVQRRCSELTTLGLSPRVEPETLRLDTELSFGSLRLQLSSDRRGHFAVTRVERDGAAVQLPFEATFELSEFRDRGALQSYLGALVGQSGDSPGEGSPAQAVSQAGAVLLEEVSARFGPSLRLPPQSPLELLVELDVGGQRYRFAAARVLGRTFRGLLAGPTGKLWAGRFELQRFPGVAVLAAQVLQVPVEKVRILGVGDEA